MKEEKTLKDPIYGYILIPTVLMERIVDTPEFQRLRDVIQTSYAPLYSSAVHNRFVHSIGVYYLGTIVADAVIKNLSDEDKKKIENLNRILEIFKLACLLHDIGHAPFSHTGEDFYLGENGKNTKLHDELDNLIKDDDFAREISTGKDYSAAPHELMSAIVALQNFDREFQNDEEKSFFARCIIGYKYKIKKDTKHTFLNCIISLLNSNIIDVDKLDYLIRDAYITGYDTVNIDYRRLLSNIKIYSDNGEFKIVYKKGAISVIEDVVYARDSEKKWIQSHPVVIYESFLLNSVIKDICEKYKNTNIFSFNALSEEGVMITQEFMIRLFSDADILFLMKNLESNSAKEYYSRKERRHPLWKSESEYKAIFNQGFDYNDYARVERILDEICKLCGTRVLDEKAIDKCKTEIDNTFKIFEKRPDKKTDIERNKKQKEKYLKWLETLKEFAEEQGIPFDFVVLDVSQFNSGFSNIAFENIEIDFGIANKTSKFKEVANVPKANASDREKFFYVFSRRPADGRRVDVNKLAAMLGKMAREESIFEMEQSFSNS